MTTHPKVLSPVGWYVGSYVIRFVELDVLGNDDPQEEFLVWENTIIASAPDFDEAYRKVVAVAETTTDPYKGGPGGVPVQWVFEGVTQLLPIYESLEDGSEIMYEEHASMRLDVLRQRVMSLDALKDQLNA
ncbi:MULTISPECIES: DUF4288 domain-containing protein [unclassified Xanthomonas]|uniref:DUF4288 domain-containing protein n=1 Tax=unclassified Xanthomonas TaxID=2643310 RepID=UPI002A810D75|nr:MULTISPECIES: DUF4288 domain-containing protein [unclassified Xanthomonas]MDY4295887.1 DUF4288 domain-containing protein [Xanthomonas sp. LF02-5]MDY4357682.1 DUF4288 domain-containing protein [Xanthomonas sp. LF04-12]